MEKVWQKWIVVNHKDSLVSECHLEHSDLPGRKWRTVQLPSAQWQLTLLEDKEKGSLHVQMKIKSRYLFILALWQPKGTQLATHCRGHYTHNQLFLRTRKKVLYVYKWSWKSRHLFILVLSQPKGTQLATRCRGHYTHNRGCGVVTS